MPEQTEIQMDTFVTLAQLKLRTARFPLEWKKGNNVPVCKKR